MLPYINYENVILTGFIVELNKRSSNNHRGQGSVKKELHYEDAKE
jgi:hypothetical protein